MLTLGIKGKTKYLVQKSDFSNQNNNKLDIFSSVLINNLIESTIQSSIKPFINENITTIVRRNNISYFCQTPVGMTVCCETELVKINGLNLTFKVKIFDDVDILCTGIFECTLVTVKYINMKAKLKIIV